MKTSIATLLALLSFVFNSTTSKAAINCHADPSVTSSSVFRVFVPGDGCTGFAVNQKQILTAAHCFPKVRKSATGQFKAEGIFVGNAANGHENLQRVVKLEIPDGFDRGSSHLDIALLTVENRISNFSTIGTSSLETNDQVIVGGYGYASVSLTGEYGSLNMGNASVGSIDSEEISLKPLLFRSGYSALGQNASCLLTNGDSGGGLFKHGAAYGVFNGSSTVTDGSGFTVVTNTFLSLRSSSVVEFLSQHLLK